MDTCNHVHTIVRYFSLAKPIIYPAYQQELLGIVFVVQEWRHYIEGAKKIACITDHATLRHLISTENVNALTTRRFALWYDIIYSTIHWR